MIAKNSVVKIQNLVVSQTCKPLELIFSQSIGTGSFLLEWEKANVVPVYKKGDKQCLKNYRPVSLIPICEKIIERLTFNEFIIYLIKN